MAFTFHTVHSTHNNSMNEHELLFNFEPAPLARAPFLSTCLHPRDHPACLLIGAPLKRFFSRVASDNVRHPSPPSALACPTSRCRLLGAGHPVVCLVSGDASLLKAEPVRMKAMTSRQRALVRSAYGDAEVRRRGSTAGGGVYRQGPARWRCGGRGWKG